jgi:hypothetical protein
MRSFDWKSTRFVTMEEWVRCGFLLPTKTYCVDVSADEAHQCRILAVDLVYMVVA